VVDPVEHPRLGKKDEVGLKTADLCRKWVIDSTWIKALGPRCRKVANAKPPRHQGRDSDQL
jgi:hypothetical protein